MQLKAFLHDDDVLVVVVVVVVVVIIIIIIIIIIVIIIFHLWILMKICKQDDNQRHIIENCSSNPYEPFVLPN